MRPRSYRIGALTNSLSFCIMAGHREKAAFYKPGGRSSLGSESAGTLIWDRPASRTVRNERGL